LRVPREQDQPPLLEMKPRCSLYTDNPCGSRDALAPIKAGGWG
jgi:hypothetical protein